MTFTELLAAAQKANSPEALYEINVQACDKLRRNIGKAQFMSMMNGRADEAEHYFQNVIPAWQNITNEIGKMFAASVAGMSTEEIVSIVAGGRK